MNRKRRSPTPISSSDSSRRHSMESTGRGTGSTLPFIPIRRVTCTHARAIFIHASAYCDWVVDLLNRDLPYDKFLIMQLAADQASPSDRSALAAMGYLTLGRRFLGVTHDITDDRIDVVCRGMLGLTVGNPTPTLRSRALRPAIRARNAQPAGGVRERRFRG